MKLEIGKLTIEVRITWGKKYLEEVKAALRAGYKIEAVKIYKNNTGLGLKESKEAVDKMEIDEMIKRNKTYHAKE